MQVVINVSGIGLRFNAKEKKHLERHGIYAGDVGGEIIVPYKIFSRHDALLIKAVQGLTHPQPPRSNLTVVRLDAHTTHYAIRKSPDNSGETVEQINVREFTSCTIGEVL